MTVTAPKSSSNLTISFGGDLDAVAQPVIVASDQSDTIVYTPQYANALLVTGSGPNGTTAQVPLPTTVAKATGGLTIFKFMALRFRRLFRRLRPLPVRRLEGPLLPINGTGFTGAYGSGFRHDAGNQFHRQFHRDAVHRP